MLKENVRRIVKILCLFMAPLLILGLVPVTAAAAETQDIVTENTYGNDFGWLWTLVLIIIAIVCTAILGEYRLCQKKNQLIQKHKLQHSASEKKNQELQKLNHSTKQALIRAQFCIHEHELWKEQAIRCVPEIERMVRVKFAKEEADSFNQRYLFIKSLSVYYNTYSNFVEALEAYEALSDKAKNYAAINVDELKQKRDASLKDYIIVAQSRLKKADEILKGTAEHLEELNSIINFYNELPMDVASEISGTIVTSLMMKKANAEYENALEQDYVDDDVEPEKVGSINEFFNDIRSKFVDFWYNSGLSQLCSRFRSWCKKKFDRVCHQNNQNDEN